MTDILASIAEHPFLSLITALLAIASTVALIHFTLANIRKTNAESFKTYWARIDELEKKSKEKDDRFDALEIKLNDEISKRDQIIAMLQNRIFALERQLRANGLIPFTHEGQADTKQNDGKKPSAGIFGIRP